jgi:leader peptidase (prepilin peptidase)/N-methyltransferase
LTPELQQILLSPWVLGLLGLCIGSFLNVVIHRMPIMMERDWWSDFVSMSLSDDDSWRRVFRRKDEPPAAQRETAKALTKELEALPKLNLMTPASRCPSCGHQLRWHENVPVVGYLRLGGKCAACKTPISSRYPIIELATGLLFGATAWHVGAQPVALAWCGFVAALIAMTFIDIDIQILPDQLTLPLMWAGLLLAMFGLTVPLKDALWGAIGGYMSLWSVYWLFKLTRGKEGMGYGDFKLLAAIGAWLGWKMLLPVVLAASVVGAVVGIIMKVRSDQHIPFGPYLAGGGLAMMFIGQATVLDWLGWSGY